MGHRPRRRRAPSLKWPDARSRSLSLREARVIAPFLHLGGVGVPNHVSSPVACSLAISSGAVLEQGEFVSIGSKIGSGVLGRLAQLCVLFNANPKMMLEYIVCRHQSHIAKLD